MTGLTMVGIGSAFLNVNPKIVRTIELSGTFGASWLRQTGEIVTALEAQALPPPTPTTQRTTDEGDGGISRQHDQRYPERNLNPKIATTRDGICPRQAETTADTASLIRYTDTDFLEVKLPEGGTRQRKKVGITYFELTLHCRKLGPACPIAFPPRLAS
ncbi:MAG: hypothetical protein ACYTFA_09350 [Planctomycetota bacterium]